MVDGKVDWAALRETTNSWLQTAYSLLQQDQAGGTEERSKVNHAATCCLLMAREYLATAFEAFVGGRPYAGLACCRPVAEMAFTLGWCLSEDGEELPRIGRWMRDTLQQELSFVQSLRSTSLFAGATSGGFEQALQAGNEALSMMPEAPRLPKPKELLAGIKSPIGFCVAATDAYVLLYQFFCSGAHSRYAALRYFEVDKDGLRRTDEVEASPASPVAVLTAAFYLVDCIHRWFKWDAKEMTKEYERLVRTMGVGA